MYICVCVCIYIQMHACIYFMCVMLLHVDGTNVQGMPRKFIHMYMYIYVYTNACMHILYVCDAVTCRRH